VRALSLHHLIAPEVPASELVRIAATLGCRHVCLFTQDPGAGLGFPVVEGEDVRELRRAMSRHAVSAYGIASFALTAEVDVAAFEPALARGAELGAARANVRIVDPDESRAAGNFAAFSRLGGRYGIETGIEFMGFGETDALPQAVRILRAAGCGKVALDALHVVRTGTSMAALRELDPDLIGYFQLCDGPLEGSADDYAREGAFDRLPPGEGAFPLHALLALVPANLPISLEVPTTSLRAQGLSAEERARRIVEATRRLLAEMA